MMESRGSILQRGGMALRPITLLSCGDEIRICVVGLILVAIFRRE